MKANKYPFVIGVVLVLFALLVSVVLVDIAVSIFVQQPQASNGTEYSMNEMVVGVVSEAIRAIITVYLYAATVNKGSSLLHGIKFGLLYSALIASLYIILGYFYFELKNPVKFAVVDSLILLVQGVTSGAVLYFLYKSKSDNITADNIV